MRYRRFDSRKEGKEMRFRDYLIWLFFSDKKRAAIMWAAVITDLILLARWVGR
jgi:hypothetical protein